MQSRNQREGHNVIRKRQHDPYGPTLRNRKQRKKALMQGWMIGPARLLSRKEQAQQEEDAKEHYRWIPDYYWSM